MTDAPITFEKSAFDEYTLRVKAEAVREAANTLFGSDYADCHSYNGGYLRDKLLAHAARVEAPVTEKQIAALTAENKRLREGLEEIAGHTGASLMQTIPSDDAIIIGHIRSANEIARAALREDTHA